MIWALHGAVGSASDWKNFAISMRADGEEIRRIDLWRFLDCCAMSLEDCGRALSEEVARIDPEPVIVGYSMGGRLALHALLAKPDLWKAAVIVSAHPGLNSETEKAERRAKDAEWSALALKAEWSDFLDQWQQQGVLEGVAMPDRTELKSRRASIARSFVDWSLGIQKDLTKELASVTCPVLWLTGERDVKFTRLAESAITQLGSGKHVTIPECGHRIPWEKPEVFSKECRVFLNQLEI